MTDHDPTPEREPKGSSERLIFWILFFVITSLLFAELFVDYHPVKLAGLFVILFKMLLLAVHEAGHALVAGLLGWRVGYVEIGMGRPVAGFRIGRTTVVIRMFPIEGFVLPLPSNLRHVRWKNALIYFAGPGSELLLLGILALVLGPDTLLTRSESIAIIAAQSLALAILIDVVLNLTPLAVLSPHGSIPNDGLGIIRSFLLPESYYAELIDKSFDSPDQNGREP